MVKSHNILVIILFALLIIIAGVFLITKKNSPSPEFKNADSIEEINISDLPIFKNGLEAEGIVLDELGYHTFSKDGKYFVFTGIKNSEETPTKTYLLNVKTGETTLLPGILLRGFEDNRIVSLFRGSNLVLYEIETANTYSIPTDGSVFSGTLSPDGKYYVFNTLGGIRRYNLENKITEIISEGQYDGATAWFDDSQRMLGFKENGVKIFDAGIERQLGTWNTEDKTFTPFITESIPPTSIRSATWVIPDKVARINTGWDDGSFDYILEIDTRKVVDLGDTSGALMGGIEEDDSLGLFSLINGYADVDNEIVASMYKGFAKIHSISLLTQYYRESLKIVDEDTLLYIRKHMDVKFRIDRVELVLLDLKTGTETTLQELPPAEYSRVSLYSDKNTWVLSSKNKFIIGKIK